MSIIYSTDDRLTIQIDDITFKISPLSYAQKSEIQDLAEKCIQTREMKYMRDSAYKAIRYSVKSVKGLFKPNGDSFSLELENNILTESSADALLNIQQSTKLATVCTSLVNAITGSFNDEYGKPLEGVSFVQDETEKKQ